MTRQTAPEGAASTTTPQLHLTPNPDLVVVDLGRVHPELRLDIRTRAYAGLLDGPTLRHLAYCADERAQIDAEKLAEMLGTPTIGALRRGAA